MPTTYSASLRLADIGDGELAGTWGAVTDTNICTLLESAIAGRSQVAVTTADVTLTANNGADDQARHAIIELTGASTAARNVICPSAEKLYVVWNNTTGGFDHTFKTAAGTGIAVPNGKKAWLFCDGTNVVETANYVSTLMPLTGGTFTGGVLFPDGSAGSPSIAFDSDEDVGFHFVGSGSFAAVGNGEQIALFHNTNGLTVQTLSVSGTTAITGTLTQTGAATFGSTVGITGITTFTGAITANSAATFNGNVSLGNTTGDALTVNATTTFNGPVSFVGIPTFTGNVVIGNDASDTLSVVSESTFSGAATFNGTFSTSSTATFGGAVTFSTTSAFTSTATFNGAIVANGNVTLGNATGDVVTITGNTTVGSATTLSKQSAGSFISHGSSGHTSGVITVSSSAPSGGSNGDIWFQI